jgi:galactonate dehydratase
MKRRTFLCKAGIGGAAALTANPASRGVAGGQPLGRPAPPALGNPLRITRVRFYHNPLSPPAFNQSFHIVTVETDGGITGIGEGGSPDTVAQCAAMIIGSDPSRTDHLWQLMFRGYFYPAGREKLDALGAIDLALWDIKGKALGVPVSDLLGGQAREHVECYSTGFPSHGSLKDTARACIGAGFRAFRYATADPPRGQPFNSHRAVRQTYQDCVEIREGVEPDGDWALDYHTRFDFPDAVRLSTLPTSPVLSLRQR